MLVCFLAIAGQAVYLTIVLSVLLIAGSIRDASSEANCSSTGALLAVRSFRLRRACEGIGSSSFTAVPSPLPTCMHAIVGKVLE